MPGLEAEHLQVVRAANDAVRASAADDGGHAYLCECGDLSCDRKLPLAPAEYDAHRFAPDGRVLHPVCAAREERAALLTFEGRLLRAAVAAKRAALREGLDRLRRRPPPRV